jgi:2-methylisocitrate lyase-like PEP mutase family enzyme
LNARRARLRALLLGDEFIIAPAVHDAYAARIVQAAGFPSACTSGAVLSHALLGLPDVGILSVTENVEHCRRLARIIEIPLTADADAGYGNALNVHYTIRQFEEAGVAGVNLEDQVTPRRWGSAARAEVIDTAEMVRKIEAACAARRDDNFVLIVRTDAFAAEGRDATLARIREYVAAGADVILPMGATQTDDLGRVVEAARGVPVSISVSTVRGVGAGTFGAMIDRLRALGVRRISLPQWLPSAAAKAMSDLCGQLAASGAQGPHDDLDVPADRFMPPGALRALLHADDVDRLEAQLTHP